MLAISSSFRGAMMTPQAAARRPLRTFHSVSAARAVVSPPFSSSQQISTTELGYKSCPRLRELTPRGQKEPGGGIHAT